MTRNVSISKICLHLTAAVLLTGCTTYLDNVDVRKVSLGDGTRAYRLSCNNPRQSANDCYEQAGNLCGDKGYVITQQSGAADESNAPPPSVNDVFMKCR